MMFAENKYLAFNEDSISGLPSKISENSIDVIFTDPPYGIKGENLDNLYHRDESNVVPGYIDVPISDYESFSNKWITECSRVLRPGGSIYIVSGYTNLVHILNALHNTDLVEINHLIAKYSFGVSTTKKFVSSHYHVLFWMKKESSTQKRAFNAYWKFSDQTDSYQDRLSVQDLPRDYKPGQIKNKNQLSESFITKFIMYSSNRGDTVLDPFAGSFSTGRSSLRYGRKFIGFELNPYAFEAFVPTLDAVEEVPDPTPIDPDPVELAKRQRRRDSWRQDRIAKRNNNA